MRLVTILILASGCAHADDRDTFQLFESTFQEERTDKQARNPGHSYSYPYSMMFGSPSRRHEIQAVLEVGIGGVGSHFPNNMKWMKFTSIGGRKYIPGASLRSWRTLFPHATIVGLDVDSKAVDWVVQQNLTRVIARVVNSSKPLSDEEWEGRLGLPRSFDVIVDDGDHSWGSQQRTLLALWPRLRVGGVYFMEDVLWDAVRASVHDPSRTLPEARLLLERSGCFVIEGMAFDVAKIPGSFQVACIKSQLAAHESTHERRGRRGRGT